MFQSLLDIYQKAASGGGTPELLLKSGTAKIPLDWSPNGRFLLYRSQEQTTGRDLWILPFSGDRKPFPFLATKFEERDGQFSPDGRWIEQYAVSRDGQRFLINVTTERASTAPITLILNWKGKP